VKRNYHTIDRQGKVGERKLTEFLVHNGQALLPMLELIEQSRMALDELIDVMGRASIEAVLELSARQVAGTPPQGKARDGDIGWHGTQRGRVYLKERQLRVDKPRLRRKGRGEGKEMSVPVYEARQQDTATGERMLEILLKGVSGAIRERFPELCRAITAKRKQRVLWKRERMRLAIETDRTEIPPPSLREIGHRLGYTVEFVVVKTFPEMCASYKGWRRSWFEEQRNKLRLSIREWVAAEPDATVSSVCCHFGFSQSYFQVNFPEDNKELVRRSAERVRKARADSARDLHEEVIRVVCDLQKKGIYPSLPRVRSELRPGSTRYFPLIRTAVDEAMSSFGPIMPRRNELGRFV